MHCSDYKILVVDDSRNIRKVFRDILEKVGYQVFEAKSGVEAIKFQADEPAHLILLDMVMPEMDGERTLAHLRGMGNDTPVILITSITQTDVIARCMQYGVQEMIVKPTTPEALCTKISYVLHKGEPQGTFEDEGLDQGDYHLTLVLSDNEPTLQNLSKIAPTFVAVEPCADRETLDSACEVAAFQTIIIDAATAGKALPRIAVTARESQPDAAIFALFPEEKGNPGDEALMAGYDGFLINPLTKAQIDLLFTYNLESSELVHLEDFVVQVHAGVAGQQIGRAYQIALVEQLKEAIRGVEEQHFENVVICFDLAPYPGQLLNCVVAAAKAARQLDLGLGLVAPPALVRQLKEVGETRHIPVFKAISDAVVGMETDDD